MRDFRNATLTSVLLLGLSSPVLGQSESVARVGEIEISATEFAEEMARRGGGRRGQYTSFDQRRALLDELVHERLLEAEARRLGLDDSAQIQAAMRRLLITMVSRERLQPLLEQITVTDDEVRAAFDANRSQYRTPLRVRGAMIQFSKPANLAAEKLEELRATVAGVHALALKLDPESPGFGELAVRHSTDQATRYVGGMLPWLYPGQEYRWEEQLTEALFALESVGEVGPVLETDSNLYLVRLVERDSPRQLSFERYEAGLRNQLLEEKREQVRADFFRALAADIGVERQDGLLLTIPAPEVTQPAPKTLPPSPSDPPLAPPSATSPASTAPGANR